MRLPIAVVAALLISLSVAASAQSQVSGAGTPTIASDKADYAPGELVTLTGNGWLDSSGPVHIVVNDDVGQTWSHVADVSPQSGSISDSFTLPNWFVATYSVRATQETTSGTLSAATSFTDSNPSADLDACANGPLANPSGCTTGGPQGAWTRGNINEQKAHYLEGESLPYRGTMDSLTVGNTYTITLAYDTTKSGKHALDYLTSFDRTETTANPCAGIPNAGVDACGSGAFDAATTPIPTDTNVTNGPNHAPGGSDDITQVPGNFTLYGGTWDSTTPVSAYTLAGDFNAGDSTTTVTLKFKADVPNPVLAWGGHIAARIDWGENNAAVNITGSPYHTSFASCSFGCGSQDSQLAASAVIFPGSITIVKDAQPDSGTAFPFTSSDYPAFQLIDDGTNANTRAFTNIKNFKSYTFTETQPPPSGWSLTNINCSQVTSENGGTASGVIATGVATVDLHEGENRTCTFTNTLQTGTLTVIKQVVNDNGGTATATNWQMHIEQGGNDVSGKSPFAGAESPGTTRTLNAGSYNVSESGGPSGYTQTGISGDCAANGDVSLAAGQNKTCTITNDDIAPKLHLRKVVTNDNGGTATVADFPLSADASGTTNDLSGTSPVDGGAGLKADTWALSETGPAGYSASAWSCQGGTQNGANITVGIGGEATCTITNDDIAPKLHLRKVVTNDNGGTATVADFPLSADASGTTNDLSGTSPVDGGAGLKADTWALSETGPAGYSASAWSCQGGTQNGANITVGIGGEATCTITNDDIAPKLHLRKVVTNDNGGTATVADFPLSADASGTTNDLSGTSPVDGGAGLKADTWALSETGPAGYSASAWSCQGGTQNGANITVGIGGEATCTITNDDIAPKLHLRKVVTNDNGGTATVADFPLSADASGTTNDLSGTSPVDGGAGLKADTWALSETGPAGYSASAWSCQGGTQNGANITVGIGGEATCTITNDDIAPKLHLRKVVTNDNGGTATVADFPLSADASGTTNDLSGTSPVDGGAGLKADTWALSETGPAGYSASAWSCQGGTQNGANITVGIGGEATCTITNDDIAPKLHLRKVVTNDNGGTATVADFPLSADASGTTNDLSGTSPVDGGAGLKADTWALSETGPAGYSASAWSCQGGTQNGANITVGIGGEATCTITNDDIAPKLHLRKVVTNDNGGTATVADFPLSADASGTTNDLSGTSPVDGGAGLKADTWALSETGPAGYSASAWSCQGGTQNGANITVGIGGEATCTITNDDIAPKLHLRKVVTNDNGGTATVADFPLSADASGTTNDLSGTSPVDGGAGLKADTWALSETGPAGYSASAWSCQGGTQNGANITVGIGGEATCTITNDDIAPKLHLRKVVTNDNGGTATVADFPLSADASGTTNDLSGTSPVDGGAGLKADTWALSETGPAGYSASAWSCQGGTQNGANITVGIGGEATCTITNDDIAPKLHLRKVVTNDNGGTATVADFPLSADASGTTNDLSGTSPVDGGAGLKADTWALSETGPAGYSASAWSCQGGTQNGANITVGIGGEATCTITNDDRPGTIVIVKNAKPENGTFTFTTTGSTSGPGTAWPSSPPPTPPPSSFTLTGSTASGGNTKTFTVDAGTYTVKESTQLSWILTGIGGGAADPVNPDKFACKVSTGGSTGYGYLTTQTTTMAVTNGGSVTCVFENTGNGATRTQGFWATHTPLANIAWFGGTAFGHTFPGVGAVAGIGDKTLCGRPIDTLGKLMGGFWSDISKTTAGKKRSALDQARMQLLQQLLAAELNASAFGSAPSAGSFAAWEAAYCGTNQAAIQQAQQQAASFNSKGDSAQFTPGTSADSKNARAVATLSFWDTLP